MGYYFDEHDSLERRSYADFLKGLIDNCDEYLRTDEEGAYVIAIDSAWGTGKSRFFSMFQNYLNGYLEEGKKIDGHEQKYNVVAYNAWDYDYWGDAMEPLMACIIKSPAFSELQSRGESEELTQKLLKAAGKVVKTAAIFAGKRLLGDEVVDLITGVCEGAAGALAKNEGNGQAFAAFEERTEAYRAFKESLSEIVQRTGRRFVILIDELDRCKPTFAIQTLELAKHLFDVKGIIFAFAVDVKQLSCSIKTIYGTEMDAEGYLCRFFNYIGKMPLPDIPCYVKQLLKKTRFKSNLVASNVLENLVNTISEICLQFNLSLRDIDTLVQNYYIMNTVFLRRYPNEAHELYFFLLALKYKDIEMFDAIFKKSKYTEIQKKYASAYLQCTKTLDAQINTRAKIQDIKFSFYEYPARPSTKTIEIHSVDIENKRITYDFQGRESFMSLPTLEYNVLSSWSKILFAPDIVNWEAIKDMRIVEYLYKQLEMFNFALQPSTREG